MKSRTLLLAFAAIFIVSCSTEVVPASETRSPSISPNVPSAQPVMLTPAASFTETPSPTYVAAPLPWVALEKDKSMGDWYFRCRVTGVDFEVIEILPGVDATGFLVCGSYRIPAGIHDRDDEALYYWGLLPIKNPEILDHLGERGVERFITVFGLGETYLDAGNLIGKDIGMSVNLPNARNGVVFDTQNTGRFAGEFWGDQSAVDLFARSGVLPNDDNILFPISLGLVK